MNLDTPAYKAFKVRARDEDVRVRAELAARPEAPPEILYFLAQDPDKAVRRCVAENPATPKHADLLLARDADHGVRVALAYKAVGAGLSSGERTRLYRMGLTILETLVTDQVVRVRQCLAEAIKGLADAPRQIVRTLAGDSDESVAAPVLENSPVLTEDDLLEVLKDNPPAWAQAAIARRQAVTPNVAEAIAAYQAAAPVEALIRNPGADIAVPTLERIVDEAPEIEAWHAPLAERPAMPPSLILRLARFVADPVLRLLRGRDDLSPGIVDSLKQEAERRSGVREPRQAGLHPDTATNCQDAAVEAPPQPTPDEGPRAKAIRMHRAGQLDDDTVAAALDTGDSEFVRVALALRAGMSLPTVQRIVVAQDAKMLTSLVWKAGLSMRFAIDVQKFLAKIPPNELLNARDGVDYPLNVDDMRMLLEVFGD